MIGSAPAAERRPISMDPNPPGLEPKLLYRRLDSLLGALDPSRPQKKALEGFLDQAYKALREDLRLKAGGLYAEGRDGFTLVRKVGASAELTESLEPTSPPLSLIFPHGVYIFDAAGAAALVVGQRPLRHVLFFVFDAGWVREEVDFALNTVRAALGARFLEERMRGSMREAAAIQQSLLLEEPPDFPGYDLAARSLPAEEVGGDFFDFVLLGEGMIGMAIGDASGHGLPAALLVRDVVTGLRMGVEKDLKVPPVLTKLNRVIHRSNLSSRFVSLFYGELEAGGNLIYVNAGHPPPLLFSGDDALPLVTGGTVIGPLPEARFQRGIAVMKPGDVLVMCTDGILERRGASGEFGAGGGIAEAVWGKPGAGAREILDRLFAAAFTYGEDRPWEDDVTAVVVRRSPAGRPSSPPAADTPDG